MQLQASNEQNAHGGRSKPVLTEPSLLGTMTRCNCGMSPALLYKVPFRTFRCACSQRFSSADIFVRAVAGAADARHLRSGWFDSCALRASTASSSQGGVEEI